MTSASIGEEAAEEPMGPRTGSRPLEFVLRLLGDSILEQGVFRDLRMSPTLLLGGETPSLVDAAESYLKWQELLGRQRTEGDTAETLAEEAQYWYAVKDQGELPGWVRGLFNFAVFVADYRIGALHYYLPSAGGIWTPLYATLPRVRLQIRHARVPWGEGIAGTTFFARRSVLVPDVSMDPRQVIAREDDLMGIRSFLALPINAKSTEGQDFIWGLFLLSSVLPNGLRGFQLQVATENSERHRDLFFELHRSEIAEERERIVERCGKVVDWHQSLLRGREARRMSHGVPESLWPLMLFENVPIAAIVLHDEIAGDALVLQSDFVSASLRTDIESSMRSGVSMSEALSRAWRGMIEPAGRQHVGRTRDCDLDEGGKFHLYFLETENCEPCQETRLQDLRKKYSALLEIVQGEVSHDVAGWAMSCLLIDALERVHVLLADSVRRTQYPHLDCRVFDDGTARVRLTLGGEKLANHVAELSFALTDSGIENTEWKAILVADVGDLIPVPFIEDLNDDLRGVAEKTALLMSQV
ncbi:MAG: GAF domain-containing protein, partial [Planctomycetes bacterium]|nr:GAF domain-containing protein [Planctomycetota bacterium]